MANEDEERFSEDPMEHFKIENEILKMKLKMQFGDSFQMFGGDDALPPDIENQFLKSMIQFEENFQNAEFITIAEKIGNPTFAPVESIAEAELENKVEEILDLFSKYQIAMDFNHQPYNAKEVYLFLTTDFLKQEVEKVAVEGMIQNFIYEEFVPNHHEDIKELTQQFIEAWINQDEEDIKHLIANNIVDANGANLTEEAWLQKVKFFFEAFHQFTNLNYNINEVKFNISEKDASLGHCEGVISYDAEIEKSEKITYNGPFKLYFTYENDYWYVFYYVMPGFKWN